jgi:pimeloyl-ACP methyl ester carboxylesterase
MMLDVDGAPAYAYTGGHAFEPDRPVAVFIHGAQHDHSVWALQTRYFAHHGLNVLAVDLPCHGRSAGPARRNIASLADWIMAMLDSAKVAQAMLVGHSMGSLIALDAAARFPGRVTKLALLATAFPMTVSDTLLDAARDDEPLAIDLVNQWSHSTIAAKPSSPGPGFWLHGTNQRLMERISGRGEAQLFHTDFTACNTYTDGLERAAQLRCPVQVISGRRDAMTPPRAARALVDAMTQAGVSVDTVMLDAGHAMMSEQPDATLAALFRFANTSYTTRPA